LRNDLKIFCCSQACAVQYRVVMLLLDVVMLFVFQGGMLYLDNMV